MIVRGRWSEGRMCILRLREYEKRCKRHAFVHALGLSDSSDCISMLQDPQKRTHRSHGSASPYFCKSPTWVWRAQDRVGDLQRVDCTPNGIIHKWYGCHVSYLIAWIYIVLPSNFLEPRWLKPMKMTIRLMTCWMRCSWQQPAGYCWTWKKMLATTPPVA